MTRLQLLPILIVASQAIPAKINYKYYLDNPYDALAPGDQCNGTKLDDDIREEFLEAHNYHRSRVARGLYVAKDKILPQSSDMIQLRWSCDLERAAQKWADGCEWKHDTPLPLHSESLWRIWGPESYLRKFRIGVNATNRWASEFEDLGTAAEFHKIGHAMLMTYSDQFLMGCGFARCQGPTYTQLYVVCRYFSNGKRKQGTMYREGEPITQCPPGYYGNNATALCEADEFPLPRKSAPTVEEDPFSIFKALHYSFNWSHPWEMKGNEKQREAEILRGHMRDIFFIFSSFLRMSFNPPSNYLI
ncbi:scl-17 [Pristionchus pacificus]|uniref:Scl-17 n=1 Tax=Pristionchus pacificus TaxID=54126 RepID=A0A2A6BJU3_PRIPA|nr:scl-17 [Pristionchus pacificus]|eukprot:PDM66172.1 scl-17 [Pristionchus pacificus]